MEKLRKVIISGGGTGGHIFPAIAIANALKEISPGIEILFVGALGKMEMEKVPAAGYKIEGLNISGLKRGLYLSNLWLPFKVISAVLKARSIIRAFKPQVAIGVGGYASAALIYAASQNKIPVLLQEQNSLPGKTNTFLSKYASCICVAYPKMDRYFPKDKIVLTGNPIRQEIEQHQLSREQGISFFELNEHAKTVLIIGGSQGAKAINEGVLAALPQWSALGINVIWQTGNAFYEQAETAVKAMGNTNVKVYRFIERMNFAYAAADLVVSRAGAIAVAELAMCSKAAILVPLPTAAEDHQTKNAEALVERGGAILLKNNKTIPQLGQLVEETITNEATLHKLQRNIQPFATHHAARAIASEILNLIS